MVNIAKISKIVHKAILLATNRYLLNDGFKKCRKFEEKNTEKTQIYGDHGGRAAKSFL